MEWGVWEWKMSKGEEDLGEKGNMDGSGQGGWELGITVVLGVEGLGWYGKGS